MTIVANIGFLE